MQKPLAVFAIALTFGGYAQAQSLSPGECADKLEVISKSLLQDSRDLLALAGNRTSNSDVFELLSELESATSESVDAIDSAQFMIRMYLLVSAPTDRSRIRLILEPEIKYLGSGLELKIKRLNLTLAQSQVPAGAAVLGTRIRDNVRSAADILQRVTLH